MSSTMCVKGHDAPDAPYALQIHLARCLLTLMRMAPLFEQETRKTTAQLALHKDAQGPS
jgi:hypothetical protein